MAAREDREDCKDTRWMLIAVPVCGDGYGDMTYPGSSWGNADCVFIFSSKAAAEAKRAEISSLTSSGWTVFDKDIYQAAIPPGKETYEVNVMLCSATVMPSTPVKSAANTG